jgi:hypothetical protein
MDLEIFTWFDSNADGVGDFGSLDSSGDGYADTFALDGNHDGYVEGYAWDTNADGIIDTVAMDTNLDGYLDSYGWDVDGDGVLDYHADPETGGQPVSSGLTSNVTTVGGPGSSWQHTLAELSGQDPLTDILIYDVINSANEANNVWLRPTLYYW